MCTHRLNVEHHLEVIEYLNCFHFPSAPSLVPWPALPGLFRTSCLYVQPSRPVAEAAAFFGRCPLLLSARKRLSQYFPGLSLVPSDILIRVPMASIFGKYLSLVDIYRVVGTCTNNWLLVPLGKG